MLGKVLALSSLLSFVLLSALTQATSPSTIHPVGILLVFILMYVLALGALTFLVYGIGKLFQRRRSSVMVFPLVRAYYFASVLALAPIMIVAARSVGRTGFVDVLLITVFEILACFYIAKRT